MYITEANSFSYCTAAGHTPLGGVPSQMSSSYHHVISDTLNASQKANTTVSLVALASTSNRLQMASLTAQYPVDVVIDKVRITEIAKLSTFYS